MAIFNDLKKLFFGAKSVAKHQAERAGEAAKKAGNEFSEASDDLIDSTKQAAREFMDNAPGYINKGKDALEDLTDKIWREADAAVDKGKELKDKASDAINSKLDDLNPKPAAAADDSMDFLDDELDLGNLVESDPATAPKTGSIDFESDLIEDEGAKAPSKTKKALGEMASSASSALDAAAKTGAAAKDKIGAVSEAVGAKVLKKGDEILGKAAEAGAGLKSQFDDFVDHANTEAEKMKIEEAIEEAKRAAEQAEARAKAFDGKEGDRDTSGSILDGTGSFFDRADRFAKGDYHNEGGKEMTIKNDPDAKPKTSGGKITGFSDSDGDGDSLIDDAVIDED